MKIHIDEDWIKRLEERDLDEPGGLMACSPEIMRAAEEVVGRKWDGTQEDAEWLVREYMKWPGM